MSDAGRALVTGATGFLGSHLAPRLLRDGWEVHALVRESSATDDLRRALPDLELHPVTPDAHSVVDAVRRADPDVCWHLATRFVAEHGQSDVDALVEANIAFGARVLEGLAQVDTSKIVYTGSAWQHHRGQTYAPTSLYAATKQALQVLARYYTDTGAFSMVALRLFDTYGPDDRRGKLVSTLLDASAEETTLKMSPGEQLIDLTHVDDVVDALVIAADYPARDGVPVTEHTVRSGEPVTLRELVSVVEDITGEALHVEWGARPYRTREMMADWEVGTPLPGWRPTIPLREGLADLWTRRARD